MHETYVKKTLHKFHVRKCFLKQLIKRVDKHEFIAKNIQTINSTFLCMISSTVINMNKTEYNFYYK